MRRPPGWMGFAAIHVAVDVIELADGAIPQQLVRQLPLSMPATIVVDLQQHTVAFTGSHHPVAFGQRQGHRFLADDRFDRRRLGAFDNHLRMQLRVCGDNADIRPGTTEHLAHVVVQGIHAESRTEGFQFLPPSIDPGHQFGARVGDDGLRVVVRQVGETELIADATGTDQGDAEGG